MEGIVYSYIGYIHKKITKLDTKQETIFYKLLSFLITQKCIYDICSLFKLATLSLTMLKLYFVNEL